MVEAIDPVQARAVVSGLRPHKLAHPPQVANVSLVVIALAVDQPAFDPDQASRFLLTAERTGLPVQLLLTKGDLLEESSVQPWFSGCGAGV